ncbi:MAG TPA: sigma-70 family RNA polymerase sigma factor [Nocardioides sp.]|nr:sigma-70 family RNA polymerase sigma factor [Nocardioides sp.]
MTSSDALPDDASLVAGVLAGDRQAFASVYEKYADRLHDFAFSMLRNPVEAQDCVADSFVLMAEKVGQLRDPSRLRPWLYSVVRNECLRTLRARGREAHDDEWLEAMPDQGRGPEDQVADDAVQAELRELVWAAVEGLNDRDRALIDLHLRQGLEGAELAAAMDVTPANAYVMLSRARDQVERALGALLIARKGSEDCAELAGLLKDWDGTFSPLIRKRVARHIDGCEVCETRRKLMVSPLALFAGVPAFAAPPSLRDRVLGDERLVAFYVDAPPPVGAPAGAGADDGSRRRRALAAIAAVLLLLAGVGLLAVLWPEGEDDLVAVDTPTSASSTPASSSTAAGTTTSPTPSGKPTSSASPSTDTSTDTSTDASTDATVAAPADLRVSTRSIDLGTGRSSETVRLSNVGGSPLDFTARPRVGWLSVSTGGGTIAADDSTGLRITATRSGLSEGTHRGQVAVAWSGGTVLVTVSVTVNRAPVIGTITAAATSCSIPVSAPVSDGTGVQSVRVAWSGSADGQATATLSGGRWRVTIPVAVGGNVKVTFTATDKAGLRSSRSRTFTFDPCPG